MNIAKYIDHTLLKPEATETNIAQICLEAKKHNFASVCVNPFNVKQVSESLQGTNVKVCAVIGFPLGATTTQVKVSEAIDTVIDGATEIDMVMNIGAFKAQKYDKVLQDMREVVQAVRNRQVTVKVIIECCLLTDEEKRKATKLVIESGAHYVKTSTGFSTGGATIEDVKLLKESAGDKIKVKASGGIRDYETAKKMIEAGASRIGASSGVKIVGESEES